MTDETEIQESPIAALIAAAHEGSPTKFGDAFAAAMTPFMAAKIDELRPEVAASLFKDKE